MNLRKLSGNIFVFIAILFTFFRGSRPTTIITTNVLFLVLAVSCFFVWFIGSRFHITIYYEDLFLLSYILYVIASSLLITHHKSLAFEYWSLLISAFAFKLVLQNDVFACQRYIKNSYNSSFIISVSIVLQAIVPAFIKIIQRVIFGDRVYQSVQRYHRLGYLTGISMQNSVAVWFSAVLLSFAVGIILTKEKNSLRQSALICLCILSIILTKKRAILLAAAIASYFLYLNFNSKKSSAAVRMVFVSLILVAAGFVAYRVIPQFQFMWDKTFNADRALSGREAMWLDMTAMFLSAPLFGVGAGTCHRLYGYGGHNCYLQLLGEYGIVGFCLFILGFIIPYVRSLIRAKEYLKTERYTAEASSLMTALFMQTVFFIYCVSGNPVFDFVFFLMHFANMAITQNILNGKLSFQKELAHEKVIRNHPRIPG